MPNRSSMNVPSGDPNQAAKSVVDQVIVKTEKTARPRKNPAAVALGRLGGKKGGPARAAKLSASQRSQIARNAARARWNKPEE